MTDKATILTFVLCLKVVYFGNEKMKSSLDCHWKYQQSVLLVTMAIIMDWPGTAISSCTIMAYLTFSKYLFQFQNIRLLTEIFQ